MNRVKKLGVALLTIVLLTNYSLAQDSGKAAGTMQQYEKANHAGNDAQALESLQQAAKENNPEAWARLGDAYLHGRYGLNDPSKAFELIEKAAKAGNQRGMTDLGILYLNGEGVKQNYQEAATWLEKATKAGDMKAPRYLGLIYENGWGKTTDYAKAASWYQQAADKGDITSQYYLGHLYEKGLGVQQDEAKALALYTKSAARGDIISLPAMMALANFYEQGIAVGKDEAKALELYNKCAALGNAEAKSKVAEYQFPENPFIMNVTAIVQILGDGQKVAALAIEYKEPIAAESLQTTDFKVPGREISSVYVNDQAATTAPGTPGNFVIVELKTSISKESASMGGGPRMGDGPGGQNTPPASGNKTGNPGFGGPQLGQVSDKSAEPLILTAKIAECGEIATTAGQIIPASDTEMESNHTLSPDIAGFKQLVFHDETYNTDLMYNLYIPADYDPAKSYPLVLFMHDAGVVSNNPIETLTQGLGAVVWASPEDQAKHPCFVLAPQYNKVIVGDGANYTNELDITIDLVKALMGQYSIDAKRLYNTGQSMGGMTSIAMDIKYPDFFAASLLVACQWTPELVKPMAKMPLWIVVSQGDNKANPGMDAITAVLQGEGATVNKAVWNAEADKESLQKEVEAMEAKNTSINYTVFEGGNHRYTWQYAYSIAGLRDWLLSQHK